jgi:serine/threonine-protein kinase
VGEAENFGQQAVTRRTVGRYRLYEAIAAGGMATVHYGRLHGELGFARTVAVKRLHREYARDPEFVAMFIDEARLAMRVQHPNVVQTLDVVAAEGELLLVMEYVPAVSLFQLLRVAAARGERVAAPLAVAILADALRGLHAAHEATDEAGNPLDIVHRDVSPQNILVGADGCARVLDFGVAKATGRQQTTREGQVKGKFAYMAPEQITNVCVTRQSDVFAASIVLWEALTGKRLFQAESETALLARVLSAPIEPPSAAAPGLDAELDRIVLRGLSRDLATRYPTARDMARDLDKVATLPSASQIAEWVEHLAGDDLGRRAARVAEIESESRSERVSVTTVLTSGGAEAGREQGESKSPDRGAGAPRSRRLVAWLAAAALGVAAIGGAVASVRLAAGRAAEAPNTAAVAPLAPPPAPSGAAVQVLPQGTDPAGASQPASASAGPSGPSAGRKGRPSYGAGVRGAPGAAGTKCDPPYHVDSDGHLIYKAECFR